jgi:hypothetical protein
MRKSHVARLVAASQEYGRVAARRGSAPAEIKRAEAVLSSAERNATDDERDALFRQTAAASAEAARRELRGWH